MLYPIAIEVGDNEHAYGVIVPDVPGCFSAGDTLDEALTNAKEAIENHLELLAEDNQPLPAATSIENHSDDDELKGFVWAVVDIDITKLLGKSEKINVTLPATLIRRIDNLVKTHPEYGSRSGFLAQVAAEKLFQH